MAVPSCSSETGTSCQDFTRAEPFGEAAGPSLRRLAGLLHYCKVTGIPHASKDMLVTEFEALVKPFASTHDVGKLHLSPQMCAQRRTTVPALPTETMNATATHAGRKIAPDGRFPPATKTAPRTYDEAVGAAENDIPAGCLVAPSIRLHKPSAQAVLMAAVQPLVNCDQPETKGGRPRQLK